MPDRTTQNGDTDPLGDAKDQAERKLARELAKLLKLQLTRLLELTPEELLALPQSFWDNEAAMLLNFLSPELQSMSTESALFTINQFPVGVAYDIINAEALAWAGEYGFDLVSGLNDHSRSIVRQVTQDFIATPGMTIETMVQRLTPTFGPVRAEMIAVTEVTRAYGQGQIIAADAVRNEGLEVEEVWETNNDELVCPICGPNHGKPRSDGWTVRDIPAHPRCRCWYSHVWVAAA